MKHKYLPQCSSNHNYEVRLLAKEQRMRYENNSMNSEIRNDAGNFNYLRKYDNDNEIWSDPNKSFTRIKKIVCSQTRARTVQSLMCSQNNCCSRKVNSKSQGSKRFEVGRNSPNVTYANTLTHFF